MGRFVDLKGMKFGKLTVIKRTDDYVSPKGAHMVRWICRCDCGKTTMATTLALKAGRHSSCGCNRENAYHKKIAGQKYGNLTVIEKTDQRKYGGIVWRCICDCGNEVFKSQNELEKGHVTSCGCKRKLCNLKDLTGKRFGWLIVLEKTEKRSSSREMVWKCRCDCGNITYVATKNLKSGGTRSCGCYHVMKASIDSWKHGLCEHKLYSKYYSMLQRCCNTNNPYYHNYGGRGIFVCDEWLDKENGFLNFYNWAINNGYSDGLSIDRIDNNGNYEPTNCRWITMTEQKNNTRVNVRISYKGEEHTIAELGRLYKIPYGTLVSRIKTYNWDIDKALITPIKSRKKGSNSG